MSGGSGPGVHVVDHLRLVHIPDPNGSRGTSVRAQRRHAAAERYRHGADPPAEFGTPTITTALDVTVQAQILTPLAELRARSRPCR
jgi:hypothetical protein